MTEEEYKKKIENQLIEEFVNKFYEKVGYKPTVLTDIMNNACGPPPMTLAKLASYFDEELPVIHGKTIKLTSKSRYRTLVELRCIFCHIARYMGYTFSAIAHYLFRDHTTIIHNVNTFNNLYDTDNLFKRKYFTILNKMRNNYEPPVMDDADKAQDQSQSNIFLGLLQREDPAFE